MPERGDHYKCCAAKLEEVADEDCNIAGTKTKREVCAFPKDVANMSKRIKKGSNKYRASDLQSFAIKQEQRAGLNCPSHRSTYSTENGSHCTAGNGVALIATRMYTC